MSFFIGGIIFWTFMEYLIHRFLGHVWLLRTPFRVEHQKHHHKRDYFASNFNKLKATIIIWPIIFFITSLMAGFFNSALFSTGFILMYVYYEYLHKIYHVRAPKTALGAFMRKHHMSHHFLDDSLNHGVTTPLWDIVFRTYKKPHVVPVNNKFSMNWLFKSPSEKEILPKYSSDYALKDKTRCT